MGLRFGACVLFPELYEAADIEGSLTAPVHAEAGPFV